MDESICLDDEGPFSSGTGKPVLASTEEAPSLSADTDPTPVTEDPEETADAETARILAQAKSMENILLESSPTLDPPSDTSVALAPAPEVDLGQMAAVADDTTGGSPPQDALPSPATSPDQEPTIQSTEDSQEKTPQLSNYFGTMDQAEDEASSFFDQISSGTTDESPPAKENVPCSEDIPTPLPLRGHIIRERTLSVTSEEATPVSFEEVKGSGLKFVGSMESVTKFFSEATGAGHDTEGKEFFDSFTAGATGDLAAQPSAPIEILAGPVSPPVAVPGSSLPPETPPIPHEPMSMSPLPSPIHTSFMRSRSISQSQASPAPSPIHIVVAGAPPIEPEVVVDPGLKAAFPSGDDLFTAGLAMSDVDRRQDAWMPSEMTRNALVAMVTSTPGSYTMDSEQLTTTSITPSDPLGDPVQELVQRFMGEAEANKRITLTVDDVTEDAEGLRKLISAECWRSAADLTGKLLDAHNQGNGILGHPSQHTAQSLQMWFCRMALLVKLRLYAHAETECQAFGNLDKPDLYYEFYPDLYPGRRGSMVPFAFRILHAELPQYLGKSQESLDRLYYVQAITQKILANLESGLAEDGSMIQLSDESRKASHDLWTSRAVQLQYAMGNCLLRNKDYAMAIEIFEGLLKSEPAKEEHVLCGIGRIYLQMGDVKTAQHYFSKAETVSDATNSEVKCRNLMSKGFVALGQNLFSEAYNYFKQATTINPTNAVAVNNMAVCSLYMGKLRDALTTLESLVHQDPARYLQEGILFNLCTLYELESSRALHKKQALLQLVSKHKGNGFNTACLKMT